MDFEAIYIYSSFNYVFLILGSELLKLKNIKIYAILFIIMVVIIRLYVSPLRPPTKEHKKISPSQWLSEGKMRQRANYREQSFQDIKTSLAFAMSETEVVPKTSSSS